MAYSYLNIDLYFKNWDYGLDSLFIYLIKTIQYLRYVDQVQSEVDFYEYYLK